ncbi:uncharacterized protein [Physcomitrium patens]|uniref:BHLH domain-containing protein n=1 Tax=Physcomitrium patens TaxID=3218 RepID=A0A2K1KSS3_PHYPA|nr:transcription factor bHLH95-like [Physcomitrium patens]PNR56833.1 hypothetical protein PHYPA_003825 [Physcomitrium patens]|eukprot:XP_024369691.1 transcription factor bHLH95-like [Physcomitrella patens]
MPSHSQIGQVGLQLQHPAQLLSYPMPPCTPQAHCRSDSLLPYSLESWFPASSTTFEATTRSCGSPPGWSNFQQPVETPEGSVGDAIRISTGSAISQPADFQCDTWWSPITVQAAMPNDNLISQRGSEISCDLEAGASYPMIFTTDCELDSRQRAIGNIGGCDQNEPRKYPTSALAVVNVAQIPASVSRSKGASRKEILQLAKEKLARTPTSPSEVRLGKEKQLGVQKSKGSGKRPLSQRENHIWSERQRRKGMNYLFSTLRSLLPQPNPKTDKSTVIGEIIKYIQSLQVKLEMLTKKRQQVMTAVLPRPGSSASHCTGLTLLDHSNFDSSSMTAITALPPPGRESCLQSYLGTNVGLHVCGLNVFITTSSPRGRRGLLQQLLLTIQRYNLEVINATISTSSASIFHCLHCQASQNAEVLNNDLHSALQTAITNFGLTQF